MLSDRCSVLSVCPVNNVGVLWPNGWTDQDETWRAGRPWPWPHCVRWRSSLPSPKGAQPPIFGSCLLWSNGWMDQDATWWEGRPRPRPHCVTWGPSSPPIGAQPPIFGPCLLWPNGRTHLSYCWALVPNDVSSQVEDFVCRFYPKINVEQRHNPKFITFQSELLNSTKDINYYRPW